LNSLHVLHYLLYFIQLFIYIFLYIYSGIYSFLFNFIDHYQSFFNSFCFVLLSFFSFIVVLGGVHCGIYTGSYNISHISYLNSPSLPFSPLYFLHFTVINVCYCAVVEFWRHHIVLVFIFLVFLNWGLCI
jgi:hypothetical protein